MNKLFDIKKLLKTIVRSKQSVVIIDGFKVKNKKKYAFFLKEGLRCRCCGNIALFVRIEKEENCKSGFYHLVFYVCKDNEDVKLTIDHIVPKSLNGKNTEDNYQLLCEHCNMEKGNEIIIY